MLHGFAVDEGDLDLILARPDESRNGEREFVRFHAFLHFDEIQAAACAPMASVGIFETDQEHQFAAAAPLFQFGARHDGLYALDEPLVNGKLWRQQVNFPLDRRALRRRGPLFEGVVGKARASCGSGRLCGAKSSDGSGKNGKHLYKHRY